MALCGRAALTEYDEGSPSRQTVSPQATLDAPLVARPPQRLTTSQT